LKTHLNTVESFIESHTIKGNTLLSIVKPIDKINFRSLLNKVQKGNDIFFFSERASEAITILGISSMFDITIYGTDRVSKTAETINNVERNFINNWNDYNLSLPLFVGGMKFAVNESDELWNEFSDSDWFIPKFLFIGLKNKFYLAYNFSGKSFHDRRCEEELKGAYNLSALVDESIKHEKINGIISTNKDSIEEKINWNEKVKLALRKIEAGEVQKIVLSRQIEFELEKSGNISRIVEKLAERYPQCYIFAYEKMDRYSLEHLQKN